MFIKKFVNILCAFIITISVCVLSFCIATISTVCNRGYYDDILIKSGYYNSMKDQINSECKNAAYKYGIPTEQFENIVTKKDTEASTSALISKYQSFMEGKIDRITISNIVKPFSEKMQSKTDIILKDYNSDINAADALKKYKSECVNAYMRSLVPLMGSKTLLTYFRSYKPEAIALFFISIGLLIGSCVLIFIKNKKNYIETIKFILMGFLSGGLVSVVTSFITINSKYFYTARVAEAYQRTAIGDIIQGVIWLFLICGAIISTVALMGILLIELLHKKKVATINVKEKLEN